MDFLAFKIFCGAPFTPVRHHKSNSDYNQILATGIELSDAQD